MIATDKAKAFENYKECKNKYLQTGTNSDWISFCEAKKTCMLLGVRI